MGEPEAWKAIRDGSVEINGMNFIVEKQPQGSCDGCYYNDFKVCADLARHICCTGGNILKRID